MTRREAEKLLGGHAPGILTEAERRVLYEAALEDQALFDALADEEALRELLADPAARAQLLAALRPARPPVPLWRRPGVLGVAAGLLVAGLATLAVRRTGQETLPALKSLPLQALPAPAPVPPAPVPPVPVPRPALERQAPAPAQAAPPAGNVLVPAPPPPPPTPQELRDLQVSPAAAGGAAHLAPGIVVDAARAGSAPQGKAGTRAKTAPRPAAAGVEVVPSEAPAAPRPEPSWTVESLADGSLRILVRAPESLQVLLLRRRDGAVSVVHPAELDRVGALVRWSLLVAPAPGEVLDLYGLARPVADPATLPAATPAGGFWARLTTPGEKAPAP